MDAFFLRPWALWAVPLIVLLAGLAHTGIRRRRARVPGSIGSAPTPTTLAVGFGLTLAAFALAGPITGARDRSVEGRDLTIWIGWDVSASMSAPASGGGFGPTRFDEGRWAVTRLLAELPGIEVGLAVFGESGHAVVPPTRDLELVAEFVDALSPGMLTEPGSSGAGLADLFALGEADRWLIVSDGEVFEPEMETRGFAGPVDLLWTDRPAEVAVGGSATSIADSQSLRPLVESSGGRWISLSDSRALDRYLGRLRGDAESLRFPEPGEEPVDGTPGTALLAALLLLVGGGLRRGAAERPR